MINDQDIEQISAYLDGELSSEESTRFKARLLAEPALRAEYDALKGNDDLLRGFAARSDAAPPVMYPELRQDSKQPGRLTWGLVASVVMVMVVASFLRNEETSSINDALATTLSGDRFETEAGFIEPQMTFKHANGQYCREFVTQDSRAVACKAARDWVVLMSVPEAGQVDDGYYQPASNGTQKVDSFISGNMTGDAYDHADEAELIEAGWQ